MSLFFCQNFYFVSPSVPVCTWSNIQCAADLWTIFSPRLQARTVQKCLKVIRYSSGPLSYRRWATERSPEFFILLFVCLFLFFLSLFLLLLFCVRSLSFKEFTLIPSIKKIIRTGVIKIRTSLKDCTKFFLSLIVFIRSFHHYTRNFCR